MKHACPPAVVFSDLDGTLLDHHTYSFEPMRPVLRLLEARGIPLVLTTSKTLAELGALRTQLGNTHPAVAENGGHVFTPAGYFARLSGERAQGGDVEVPLGVPYGQVREVLQHLRAAQPRFAFRGFGDLDDRGVAEVTGLPLADAARARQRRSSEPLQWLGDPADIEAFRGALADAGLRLNRGGRFLHVQARVDKADGMRYLLDRFAAACGRNQPSIAAGDGDNDLGMLRAADHAIVVPPGDPDRAVLQVPGAVVAAAPGPVGLAPALVGVIEALEGE